MLHELKIWILASRFPTLTASICPLCIGTVLALEKNFDVYSFIFALLFILSFHLGMNLANDYFDYVKGVDTTNTKATFRITLSGQLSLSSLKKSFILMFATSFLLSLFLLIKGEYILFAIVPPSILCAIFYSGGSKPLSYLGLGDLLVSLFFGPIITFSAYFLQTHQIDMLPLIASLSPAFFSVAILTINNLRDIQEDKQAGKKTLVVRLGRRFGKWEYFLAVLIACLGTCFLAFFTQRTSLFIPSFLLFMFFPLIKNVFSYTDEYALNAVLEKTVLLFFVHNMLFCAIWLIGM